MKNNIDAASEKIEDWKIRKAERAQQIREELAELMPKPIRNSFDYQSIARKILNEK
jgi:hypothetical protein